MNGWLWITKSTVFKRLNCNKHTIQDHRSTEMTLSSAESLYNNIGPASFIPYMEDSFLIHRFVNSGILQACLGLCPVNISTGPWPMVMIMQPELTISTWAFCVCYEVNYQYLHAVARKFFVLPVCKVSLCVYITCVFNSECPFMEIVCFFCIALLSALERFN